MKKNQETKKTAKKTFRIAKKRAYIALFAAAVIISLPFFVNRQAKTLDETSFDTSLWDEAMSENAVISQSEEIFENDSSKESYTFSPEVATVPEKSVQEETVPVIKEEKTLTMIRPSKGEIISDFSGDEFVYSSSMDDWRTHNGIDFASAAGEQVICAADGVVSDVYNDDLLGVVVTVEHIDGVKTLYGNLQSTDFISKGKEVKKGDIIGGVGDAGILESDLNPHLHFEVIKGGDYQNPHLYFSH